MPASLTVRDKGFFDLAVWLRVQMRCFGLVKVKDLANIIALTQISVLIWIYFPKWYIQSLTRALASVEASEFCRVNVSTDLEKYTIATRIYLFLLSLSWNRSAICIGRHCRSLLVAHLWQKQSTSSFTMTQKKLFPIFVQGLLRHALLLWCCNTSACLFIRINNFFFW